ncbi:pathogenesis-related protein 1A-like [Silene latifolia]|uniref:pathogenesis-related protein 1A-like n=1 Tax=Silene latifolia TaxID=37657 RepID=UPI003D76AE16
MKISFALAIISTIFITSQAQNNPIDYIAAHKSARSAVGVATLVWDTNLAKYAQTYANQRAADCNLVHSATEDYGENIAVGYGYSNGFTGVDAVNLWVAEKPHYDYYSNTCKNGECGHYTQVVWRDTVRLGCARVTCKNGGVFVTCNYDPPGNYEGEKPY